MKLNIRMMSADTFEVEAEESDTVSKLKSLIHDKNGTPPEQQKLVFRGRILRDDDTLESCRALSCNARDCLLV